MLNLHMVNSMNMIPPEMWSNSEKSLNAYYLEYPFQLISRNIAQANHIVERLRPPI